MCSFQSREAGGAPLSLLHRDPPLGLHDAHQAKLPHAHPHGPAGPADRAAPVPARSPAGAGTDPAPPGQLRGEATAGHQHAGKWRGLEV